MLKPLIDQVRAYPGIASKISLAPVISYFESRKDDDSCHDSRFPNGDDCAILKTTKGYDLFAIEGFIPEFVVSDPWFAGWCSVMVNVSDITAMGGRSRAVVNALWDADQLISQQIFAGMQAAASTYRVPVVGGHTSHNSNATQLAVSILGHADYVLTSFNASPGEAIVVAMDHRGAFRPPYLNWNASTDAPGERLRGDIELLPSLAEKGWLTGCKDISQAGLLGTLAMFMDCSQTGADVFLQQIPKPDDVGWQEWLCAFPSFGFLMTCPVDNVEKVVASFENRDIRAARIGTVTERPSIDVIDEQGDCQERETFWDFETSSFLGFRQASAKNFSTETSNIEPQKKEAMQCLL